MNWLDIVLAVILAAAVQGLVFGSFHGVGLVGLIFGFWIMFSALRAPLGIDLLQMPAVEAGTAYGYRSLALVLIA